jgi:hypothetical protein
MRCAFAAGSIALRRASLALPARWQGLEINGKAA